MEGRRHHGRKAQEKDKDRLMEDKFNELLGEAKKSKDTGKPIRDIDLD